MVVNIISVAAAMAAVAAQPRNRQIVGNLMSPTIFVFDAAIMTAIMIGTEMTALMTADQ